MRCFALWISLLLVTIACNSSKPAEPPVAVPEPEPEPVYYFYPRANVYFDSVNKTYTFLGTDGASWQTAKAIPAVAQQLLDKGALVDSPATPVWRDNERHKIIYAAQLYATAKDTQEVKVPVIVPAKDTVEKKKERKGLGKFFQRIFKGNRKKKD